MPPPNLIIAGAQKCGTSSLAATLRRHPQVYLARPKELHFFDRHFDQGLDHYASLFSPRPVHVLFGEATPVYLYDSEARRRMCESLPEAKFVVILRDPVKRAYSHFWHSRRLGLDDIASFEEAIALEPERLAERTTRALSRYSYVDRGRYVDQLVAVTELVGRHRLHVMLLDDLTGDRINALERLFGFLGIEKAHAATIEPQWTNRHRMTTAADGKPVPVTYPPMAADTRARLVELFRPYNLRLESWLDRDLSEWSKI